MSPTAVSVPKTVPRPRAETIPGGYTGKLLRVNLTTGKIWTQPWTPEEMRTYVGGVGIGAKILYDEVGPKVHWEIGRASCRERV